MLQHVVQGISAPGPKTREHNVTAPDSTRERFDDLFLAHYSRIVAILYRMLGDRARAEDLANETFLKLYRHPLRHQPDGNVSGWLYRTATNLGIDALRSTARRIRYAPKSRTRPQRALSIRLYAQKSNNASVQSWLA